MEVNFLAVIVAAVSAFLLGGAWYSKPLFGAVWSRENGTLESKAKAPGHPAKVFGISFLFSLLSAFVLALWLGPDPPISDALFKGLYAGFGFVAASFGINYQFANRSFIMWLIDAGYHTIQFILYALILGLWH